MNNEWPDNEWPDMEATPLEWVKYGLNLIRDEVDCTLHHAENGVRTTEESDYYKVMLHLQNMVAGLGEITNVMFTKILNNDEKLSLVVARTEQDLGCPVTAVEVTEGVWKLEPKEIVVPDDVETLFGKRGEGDGE